MSRKGLHWPFILGGLMLVVLGANAILFYLAVSDPSFAVEEDYYQKALAWDDKRAQDRRNDELGWTLSFDIATARAPDGTLQLTATLADRDGRSIADAAMRVTAFHNARGGHLVHADVRRQTEGGYAAALPLRRPGLWEFRFEVSRGGQRFTFRNLREVGWIR